MRALVALLFLVFAAIATPAQASPRRLAPGPLAPAPGGGGDGAGSGAAFVALGMLGTGVLVGAALVASSSLDGPYALLAAFPLIAGLHVGLGALLGVPVGWASALVGVGLGAGLGVAGGFLGAALLADGEGFTDLAYALLGLFAGIVIGTPVATLVDPFGLASSGEGAGTDEPWREQARPLVRTHETTTGSRGLTLAGGRF